LGLGLVKISTIVILAVVLAALALVVYLVVKTG
jgi:hypothetical protein